MDIVNWMVGNWTMVVAIFWMLEKIVKITPFPYDDILVDVLWNGLKKAMGK